MVHGTCVAIGGRGVLLRGPSGSGKSDLALRLIDSGGLLVADDQTVLGRDGGFLVASAPPALRGRLEIRGLGICAVDAVPSARLALIVDLVPASAVERLPAPAFDRILGVRIARIAVAPFEASAAAKVRLALATARLDSDGRP